jgi:tRNA (guanine26-N2/guanine27-N2)-dimethyltransferase
MGLGFSLTTVNEGKATILIPLIEESDKHIDNLRSQAPVFYNPQMKLNRDTAVLALLVLEDKHERPLFVSEPMCGTGVRGIRFALETNISKVILGDISPSSIKLAEKNIVLNNVQDKVHTRLLDANLLLSLHCYPGGRFDYVDIDPFGPPTPFLDTSIRSIKDHGMIAITATDMAPLCGVNPNACLRKYGGWPIQASFCHEVALRLVTGAIIQRAAVHEIEATPNFSYYANHYVRLYTILRKGAKRADRKLKEMGYIHFCSTCLYRETGKNNKLELCPRCSNKIKTAGPLWLGALADNKFCEKMISIQKEIHYGMDLRLPSLIENVKNEIDFPPTFYIIDELCSIIGVKSMPTNEVIKRIKSAGFKVITTHYNKRGIKTEASLHELLEVLN